MKALIFILFIFLIIFPRIGFSQPQPCGNVADMTSFCNTACLVCDIDGFTGRNDLQIQGQTVPGFCTTVFHNMNYIAFTAGTENLKIKLDVFSCNIGLGVEVGFYESLDCENFSKISVCNTDIPANTSYTFSNTVPLVVGQYYYLIMDGSSGDRCNWKFNVIEGSTKPPALLDSGVITAPSRTCPDSPTPISVTPTAGAIFWRWSINGVLQSQGAKDVNLIFPSVGTFDVCVQAANVCDEAPEVCKKIEVAEIENQYFIESLCKGDVFVIDTLNITESGSYERIFNLPNGCDSIVRADITFFQQPEVFVDINMCSGENFMIGNKPYNQTGIYKDSVDIRLPCDSIVNLDLFVIECEIIGQTFIVPVICYGEASGSLIFSILNGTPPFTYQYEHITDPSILGTGTTSLFDNNVINNLPIGVYEVNIQDNFGNDVVLFEEITQPSPIKDSPFFSDYLGVNVSCYDGSDGSIHVDVEGGIPPYQYIWGNGTMGNFIDNLSHGKYFLSILDASGCLQVKSYDLISSDSLSIVADFVDPDCSGFDTGEIIIDSTFGGLGPYLYSINNSSFSGQQTFFDLLTGTYNIKSMDQRGCINELIKSIEAPEIPIIELVDEIIIELGQQAELVPTINDINLKTIMWQPSGTLECPECLESYAFPINTTKYTLYISSEDDCVRSDSVLVTVLKIRHVYAANIFSPNEDGIQDFFNIDGGRDLELIEELKIFDRWGNLIYSDNNLIPGDLTNGWDGRFHGKPVASGIYGWIAKIRFIDNEVEAFSGDIAIVR